MHRPQMAQDFSYTESTDLVKQLGDKLVVHAHLVTVAVASHTAVDSRVGQLAEQQALLLHDSADSHLCIHPSSRHTSHIAVLGRSVNTSTGQGTTALDLALTQSTSCVIPTELQDADDAIMCFTHNCRSGSGAARRAHLQPPPNSHSTPTIPHSPSVLEKRCVVCDWLIVRTCQAPVTAAHTQLAPDQHHNVHG